jgi:hypothetical protein
MTTCATTGVRDPLLRHRVALAHRHRLVLEGVEVDRDAVRRADLVLAAVARPIAPASSKSTFQTPAQLAARSSALGERSALRDSGSTAP